MSDFEQGSGNFDPTSTTLVFVNRRDEITGDDDPTVLRVQMSCGHAVDPKSLTAWCRSLIEQNHFTFHCPAAKENNTQKCNKIWSYLEVRRHALLDDEEQQYFEERVSTLAAAKYCEYKWCPGCESCVERKDLTSLHVRCTICKAEKGKNYEFCWQCMKQWKGKARRSDRCDNEGCTNIQLETLRNCVTKVIMYGNCGIQDCPKIRACPTCGMLIEHKDMCKYVICTRCHVEFCFACLETKKNCSKSSGSFAACTKPVAPKQTDIPVWNRNSD
ncbi:probable E3 ubiquitin-protein ligase ARI5 isoform X1 [Scyliorhinus canicula]|uniref:probable E3 ubiquitin-protein ligase ARI5 isoform X1 n=1 Tax=Scyliorhinus canicula TaxID=7830 RepID=UPI0018F4DD81|nr:probable E3 ubiquitin-protein ligase ARI5 isoform X1 [Scyliorhinus canicula]